MHVIGTAGHVDHGKSTLVEALTGIDPDRFAEEKARGLTIDLGFAWLSLPSGREVGIVDVPGHERFIKNMLAGAGGITICMFVVAANEGWMPQSREHLAIIDILGVNAGVVALTKVDTVPPDQVDAVAAEIARHLEGTSLAGAEIVSCAAPAGRGIDDLIAALDRVVATTPAATDEERPRLWVDRVFTIAGAGTVVTGTLAGGSFKVGDSVEIAPEGRRARIRSIQSHKKEVPEIGPGNRTALNLAGLDRQGARRGDAIVRPGDFRTTRRVDVKLRVLPIELTGTNHEVTEKGAHLLYVGSAETPVKIRLMDTERVRAGESAFAQLQLRDALPLRRGDRFVLRDAGRILTFGGGLVLDPLPEPLRRDEKETRTQLLGSIEEADATATLRALVDAAGMIPRDAVLLRAGAHEPGPELVELGAMLVSDAEMARLADAVRRALADHHREHPLERGMPRQALRVSTGLDAEVFDALLARVDGIVEEGAAVRLADHSVKLAPAEETARTDLIRDLDGSGFTPPMADELEADHALLSALVASGDLVKIGDFYLTGERAREARAKVRAHIEAEGPVTVAQIRDLLGTSRKYAVPLCEWLDATGATVRRGDVRVLGPKP